MKGLIFQKELILIKLTNQKKCVTFVAIGIFKNWILNLTQKIVTAVTI